ncbi:MAG TPA: FHA domain-containing protein, partial [Polyangia bacterium]|nr:FHA domain-containing protein [Polyangia bacterium]
AAFGATRDDPRALGVDREDRRVVQIIAGEALLARAPRPPLTEEDRQAFDAAASILAGAGDLHRAATAFELADNLVAAAEAWGRLGDLDAMERCHALDEERRARARAEAGAWRDVDALLAAGERTAALRIARSVGDGTSGAARARATVTDLTHRLVQGRAITLRNARGLTVRAAAAPASAPAVLGRDLRAELPLRDPGVSRRHARLSLTPEGAVLADLGSRLGTFVGTARLDRAWPLRAETEVALGPSCRLRLQPGPDFVLLRGDGGLDGGLLAVVGADALPLGPLLPEADGLWLEFDGDGVHLVKRAPVTVRLGGQLASARIDLLHGDRIELDGATSLEVA